MTRHLRVEFPGAIYHVSIRMLGDWMKEANLLFEDDASHPWNTWKHTCLFIDTRDIVDYS